MARHLRLWGELFALSWRLVPGLTATLLLIQAGTVLGVTAVALLLGAAVDGALRADRVAVAAAAGVAVTYGIMAVLRELGDTLRIVAVERVGLTELQDGIHRDLNGLDGLEHLENPAYLDRVAVVRGSAWELMAGMWAAVGFVFVVVQLGVSVLLLGFVHPLLLLLVGLAGAPLWFDYRGQRLTAAAETGTAEAFRLQRDLFALCVTARGAKELQITGAAAEVGRRQSAAWREAVTRRTAARARAALWQFAGWMLFTGGFIAALVLVARQVAAGRGPVGDLVVAVTVASTLRQTLQAAIQRGGEAIGGRRVVEPYLWLRDYVARERARTRGNRPVPDRLTGGIVLDGLSYRYPGVTAPVVEDVSVHLPRGSVVAVVGETGSGKTTLVKLLLKFYRPDRGRILVDGQDLDRLDTDGWRRQSTATFQDFGRFHTRFVETVGIGDLPRVADRDRIELAVHAAQADTFVAGLPDGLDTQLGRELDGVELSEGQWQKTALARSLMRPEPVFVVLDEPTASLDARSEEEIFRRYMARARQVAGRTGAVTVIVSHRYSTVTGADLILLMHRGRLVESGTHDELLALDGHYAELYRLQAKGYERVTPAAPGSAPAASRGPATRPERPR